MDSTKTADIVEHIMMEKCKALQVCLSGEVILIRAEMVPELDGYIREEIEALVSAPDRLEKLVVVLETNGGSIEVVERVSDIFRHHFSSVVFVIPNFAFSAGTVLTLSGDEIHMDYYSVLGPIDPQVRNRDGRWVPGLGYLEMFNNLVEKSEQDKLTHAELEFLIRKFDPGELFALEQAKVHSADLIEKWLCEYMFKDWDIRESTKEPVTQEYKAQRAKDIAERLGDPTEWNSHGRGIPLRVLESDKINLRINNFGENEKLNKAVREYYDLFIDYCTKMGVQQAIHTRQRFLSLEGVI